MISAIEAHSPEGFPSTGKAPKLTAQAPPLGSAGGQARAPAAQTTARQAPAAAATPPPGLAKTPPAPAAKIPATPAAPLLGRQPPPAGTKTPAAPPARIASPSRPDGGGKLFEVDDLEDNLDDIPPRVEKPLLKTPGQFDAPRVTTAPEFDSEVSFAGVLPDEPGEQLGRGPAKPSAESTPLPKAEPARLTPIPDATLPAPIGASEKVEDDFLDIPDRKEPPPTPRREMDIPAAGRGRFGEVVDDEPTVVRSGLEEELAEATRKPAIEDEETAVPSSRSHARVVAQSAETGKDAEIVTTPRVEVSLDKRPEAPKPAAGSKPAERPLAETKPVPPPVQKQPEAARSSEEEPTEIGRRRLDMGTTKPQEGKRSPSILLLGAAAAILVAGVTYWALTKNGPEPTPEPSRPTTTPTSQATAVDTTPEPTGEAPTPPVPATAGTTTATDTAAPAPTATTTAGAAEPDPTTLPVTKAYLVVNSSPPASVYVNGVFSGNTDEPLAVLCGTRNVRLGKLTTDTTAVPEWVSPGQPAIIPCRKITTITMTQGASPNPAPGGNAPPTAPTPPPPPGGGAEPYP
ncbi:hypothetical protein [Chondromyces crocatus]|uniref:hypothetical protein n=1 Tax=Chondromyces crocatus TaxID=52 RepID=UPI001C54E003|nr:hypothetical protein [Chondromyces crocatus]